MDVITGRFKPSGKLSFALAASTPALARQASAPGDDRPDTLFPFGFGMSFCGRRYRRFSTNFAMLPFAPTAKPAVRVANDTAL